MGYLENLTRFLLNCHLENIHKVTAEQSAKSNSYSQGL